MVKVLVGKEPYIQCVKCEVYKSPVTFMVKGKKRKSCENCRKRK